jgi:hypothetical protein
VQTADAQINQSVTLSDIATLPQLGRTPITLSIFQPGVQINPQADGSSGRISSVVNNPRIMQMALRLDF